MWVKEKGSLLLDQPYAMCFLILNERLVFSSKRLIGFKNCQYLRAWLRQQREPYRFVTSRMYDLSSQQRVSWIRNSIGRIVHNREHQVLKEDTKIIDLIQTVIGFDYYVPKNYNIRINFKLESLSFILLCQVITYIRKIRDTQKEVIRDGVCPFKRGGNTFQGLQVYQQYT